MERENKHNDKDNQLANPEQVEMNVQQNQLEEIPLNNNNDKNNGNKPQINQSMQTDPNKKKPEEEEETFPKISYFRLQYHCAETADYFFLLIGFIGSMGMGCSMPLFSLIFGNTINNFGPATNPYDFIDRINKMVLNFVYCAIGVFFASFLMITFFTINGKRTVWKLKGLYFDVIMKQEQGYFDKNNPYKYATKVQNQTKTIESGVYYI
jgi:ATP-binding cassette subfamily B (MDR/TAP) protein 1